MENKLDIFIKRLQKIGIQLELIGNFPCYQTEFRYSEDVNS